MPVELFGIPLSLLLLLAGAGLVIAEAFAPGAHFFVLGVGLFVAGLVGIALPSGLGAVALLIMALAVLISTGLTLYVYREFDIYAGSGEGTTSDSSSLRGQTGRVTERVTPTDGEVKLESGGFNPYYKARSVDGTIEEGETVIVLDPGGGNVLTVESFADRTDDIDRELARDRERRERETESESSS
ncbi:NfeD family protein [Salinibaculum salinum]|uniref:NfeD family protein n=1 Tax=Salinibaculum salinum TaxID=3131996 RepID=UPI0030EF91B3